MSINRNLASFATSITSDGKAYISITVTVASVGGGNRYHFDGTSQQIVSLSKGITYRFDTSSSSVSGHPLRFSTTSDGTHNSGSQFTLGISTVGSPGSAGSYVQVTLEQDAPDHLYSYCQYHAGMGALVKNAPIGDPNFASFAGAFTFPTSDGNANEVLKTDGSGTLSFVAQSAGYANSDVDSHLNQSNPTSGYVLSWNGSDYAWVSNAGYTDANVNTHLNVSGASSGQILGWNGSDYAWVDDQSGSGGIASVLADTSPQLGGSLDVNGQSIVSTSNGNIAITPNGSGKVILDGLSYPQADGSADQVIKTDGSGNLSFVTQATGGGGGSLNATASGTLANGDMVIVNSDGTVSAIGTQSVSDALGSEVVFNTGTSGSRYMSSVSDPSSGKIVLFYQDQSNSEYGTAVVGTISGTTISFGTPAVFNAGATSWVSGAYHTASSSIVCFYLDEANSGNCNAVIATVSGTSVSFGSEQTVGRGSHIDVDYDTVNGKFLLCYRDTNDSYQITSRVISISGGTLSAGTRARISTDSGAMYPRPVYDANAQKFLISFRGASQYGKCRVATISGTSVSYGTETTFNNDSTAYLDSTYDASAQKVVIAYADDGLSGQGRIIAGTISGTSVSFGSEQSLNSADINRIRIDYDANAETVVAVYEKNIGSSMVANRITLSGTTFTVGAEFTLNSGTSDYPYIAYDSNTKVMIAAYRDDANSNKGTAAIIQNAYSVTRSLTSENFIGVSNAAYADGATATVQTAGSTDDAQSGLTAGESYYVQADGTLGTSPDTISVLAGTAVSATELLINPDTNPAAFGNTQVDAHLNLSGASSGQVLSYNGSDYAWTDDATGAGSITATASGALANGAPVMLKADGTVSIIQGAVSASVGSATSIRSGSAIERNCSVYDPDTNRVIIAYSDGGNSTRGTAIVGTVTGSSLSFGSPVVFDNGATEFMNITYDTNQDKVIIAYKDNGNSGYGTAVVGSVSGTSISFGSKAVFESAVIGGIGCYYDTNAQKTVIAYRDGGNNNYMTAIAGTVSGSSISFGTAVTNSEYAIYIDADYDANAQKGVAAYRSSGNVGKAAVISVSGTTVSFGTSGTYNSGTTARTKVAYDASAQKVVVAYSDGANSSHGYVAVGTISNTSISFGSQVVFNAASLNSVDLCYDANASKMVLSFRNDGDSGAAYVITGTVSGTSISFDAALKIQTGSTDNHTAVYDSTAKKVIVSFAYYTSQWESAGFVTTTSFTPEGLTSENYIGISNAAYADGATATIQTAGSVDDAQSGLTTAQTYYVQSTGGIGLNPSTPSVVAGTAISATQLLVKSGQPIEKPNTTQVVATGALSDGTKVCINTNGTASAISSTVQSAATGSETTFYSGGTTSGYAYGLAHLRPEGVVYDSANSKVVIFYNDAWFNKLRCKVGSISGTTITFGSEVAPLSGNNSCTKWGATYDSVSGKIVLAYKDDSNSSYPSVKIGTVSGSTITFGAASVIESNAIGESPTLAVDTTNSKIVIGYYSSSLGKVVVGTISGSTISFGSPTATSQGNTYEMAISYNVADQKVVLLQTDPYAYSGNYMNTTLRVGTVSGNGISFGNVTQITMLTGQSRRMKQLNVMYDDTNEKCVISYAEDTANIVARGVSISGTNISLLGGTTVLSATTQVGYGAYDPLSQKFVIFYQRYEGSNYFYGGAKTYEFNGSSITNVGSEITLKTDINGYISGGSANGSFVILYSQRGQTTNLGYYRVLTNAFTSQNLTATNYIGISDAAYTNGQTATIQVAGATDDAQSGLTAGQLYYVQNDGTLSTTADSPSVIAGTALSATKLIVKG